MGDLTMTLLRLGYLVLMWAFVFAVVSVLRRDLYGTKITSRRQPEAADQPGRAEPGTATSPPAPGRSRLVVVEGPLSGTTVPLKDASVLIGRAPSSSLVIDDDYVSSRHARIFTQQGEWYVEDLGSTNGTVVGETRIDGPTPLGPGVRVRIGNSVLELRK